MNLIWAFAVLGAAVSGQQCKTIDDPTAPYQKLVSLVQELSGKDLHAKVAKYQRFFSPEFEQCLANYEAPRLVSKLHPIFKSECSNLSQLTNLTELASLKANLPTLPIAAHEYFTVVPDFLTFLMSATDGAYKNVCTAVSDIGLPCAGTILQVLVSSLQDDSHGCCNAFLDQFETKNGLKLVNWVYDLLVSTRNAVCTIRQPGFDQKKDQTCGYTLMQVFGSTNVFEFLSNIAHGLQIPNDQGCTAFEGHEFRLTTWETLTLGNRTTGHTISGCSKHLDTLASKMSIFDSDLFTAGRCVSVTDLLEAAPISDNLKAFLMEFKIISKCLHLANGFSSTCEFSAQTSGELSSDVLPELPASPTLPPMDVNPPPAPKPQPTTSNSGRSFTICSTIFVLTFLLNLLQ